MRLLCAARLPVHSALDPWNVQADPPVRCEQERREEDPNHEQFRGSYTVAVTPFTEDGSAIDIPALKRFLDWQIQVGVPGIIILGTSGEFLAVSDAERRLYVDSTVKHVDGRIPVLVGR